MNHISWEISLAALVPAFILCLYIYIKDRADKEPIHMLAALFGVGFLAYIPSLICENFLLGTVDNLFADSMNFSLTGTVEFSSTGAEISHRLLCAFAGISIPEELLKWLPLFLLTFKSRHFNCIFDGIVYSSFVSLGFGSAENLRYAWIDGWDTLLLRAVTSVPAHLFFGIFMGFCYTVWHAYSKTAVKELQYFNNGQITTRKFRHSGLWLSTSIILPILVHGIYSFVGAFDSFTMQIFFYIFIALLYLACFIIVHRISLKDGVTDKLADSWIIKAHPLLLTEDGGEVNA